MKNILILLTLLFLHHFAIAQREKPQQTVQPDSVGVWTNIDSMPHYPGGDQVFMKYISKNINYPRAEKEKGIQGVVFISFIVDEKGKISDVTPVREVPNGEGLTKEAVRVISVSPDWNPGIKNGKPVKVKVVFPIRFILN